MKETSIHLYSVTDTKESPSFAFHSILAWGICFLAFVFPLALRYLSASIFYTKYEPKMCFTHC